MDNSEQPIQELRPNTRVEFPALGPAFINPDDAAYWAHQQIGDKRDMEYGGVIMKRLADSRYLATQPRPGGSRSFDVRSILSTDSQDSPIFPEGFGCYAIYHSHDRAPEGESLHKNIFSKQDQYLILRWRFFASAHDLSGPSGSLLKYTASGTAAEDAYLALLHDSVTKGERIEGSRFAEVGDLRLLVTSPVWGVTRGKITTAGASADRLFPTTALTDQQPFFTQVFDQSAKAVDAVLGVEGAKSGGGCMGFILKAVGKDEYIATLPVATLAPLFSPAELFPSRANGGPKLPSNFRIDGIYYRSRPVLAHRPAKESWLYENFFSPAELAAAIAQSRKDTYLQDSQRGLTLYMRAQDNALLSYKCSGSASETGLSVIRPDGSVGDGGTQARLMAGTLTTHDFVLQVAKAGELSVVQPGKVWDKLGAVGLSWAPFATFRWPVLSPAFLSADDAARYVHAKIGNKRDREYGGYIFQRKDQRFVACEPMESGASSLAYGLFYPTDNRGLSIFPEDHVLQARYGSHKALSMIDSAKVEALNWSRQEADVSAQMFRDEEMREMILRDLPVYLSAAEHSLIMFKPGRPEAQDLLRQRLGTKNKPGQIVLGLGDGTIKPSDVVKELAAAGDLRVVISSDLWGAVGNVSVQWAPFPAKKPVTRKVAFGAIFPSADEAAEDRDSRGSSSYDTEHTSFGFILKHRDKEEYIATELVPVSAGDKLFSLTSLFGISRPGSYSFPQGFELDAYFYSKRGIEGYPASPKNWLKHYFIDPMDLYVVVYNAKRRPAIPRPDKVCPVYISTLEGALLKYLPRASTMLFDNDTPNMGLEVIQSNLAGGALTPTDFVRVVAKSGQLSVVRSSLCWDRKGAVDTLWFRYMNLQRRPLSPVFLTADDAARYVRAQLLTLHDSAYGGLILRRPDGFCIATEPVPVPREDFDFSWIFPDESTTTGQFPAGCDIVARYRSRTQKELTFLLSQTEKQVYLNMLSTKTLRTAFGRRSDRINEYLIGPDGSLIRYLPDVFTIGVFDMERNLIDYHLLPDTLKANSIKHQIRGGVLKPSEWINRLGSMGTLQIVVGSKLWGPARWAITWTPNPEPDLSGTGYSKAITEPAYSPAFTQEEGAARYVHEQVGNRDALKFGFILKYSRDSIYIASMPLQSESSNFAYDRVFLDGSLPYRYDVQGLYVCAEKSPTHLPDEDHRHFFSPMDVQHARVRADTHQGFKPIYFSCADGALLKFKLDSFDSELSLDKFGQVEFRPNPFASLEQAQSDQRDITSGVFKLSSYIQRMAKAGNLEVLMTSPYWSRQGKVSPDWKPRMAPATPDELWAKKPVPALGPIFHHADDAARYIQLRASPLGDGDKRMVYESAILANSGGTSFIALEPLVMPENSYKILDRVLRTTPPNEVPRFPDGYKLVATHQLYRSGNALVADDPDSIHSNFISSSLLHESTYGPKARGFDIKDHYYSSPYGALLRYTPVYSTAEEALLLTRQVSVVDGHWVTHLSAGEFITRLIDFGPLRVVAAGGYWRQTGRVGADWRIGRQQRSEESTVRTRDEL